MTPRKIVTVVGARPQFIKAAALSRAIRETDGLVETMVHTGQHFDANMSHIFFEELDIPNRADRSEHSRLRPRRDDGQDARGAGTGAVGRKAGLGHRPGDTNSTLAGALAAAKLNIPLAHVEAGLRSFNRRMPEEINRVIADHLSAIQFCPTAQAVDNLAAKASLTAYI